MAIENFLKYNQGEWDVIYIRNSDKLVPKQVTNHANKLLELIFDDIDYPLGFYIMPSKNDVRDAVNFSIGKKKLLVTCYNGRSRSAGVAYICKCKECGDPSHAINILTPSWRYYPNKRVISYGAEFLENQEIYNIYLNWVPSFNVSNN